MKRYGKASCAVALGLTLAFPTGFAVAQQSSDQTLEKIEVTGSYIRRADVETPSPVQVITAKDIKDSGYTTLTDVLNNITANNQGTLSQGFAGAFAAGATGISLRGLTVGATLVLIDGHRATPYPLADDGQRSFVDLASIPVGSVERIEVLKDAASSTYGSDAMAGVVNIILKKSFTGVEVSAENGWSQHGGGQTSHLSGTIGFGDLGEDGQNAYVAIEYHHQDPMNLSQRPQYFRQDWTALGGVNTTFGGNNLANGATLPASVTGYFVNPGVVTPSGANPLNYYGYLPGCSAAAQTAGQCAPNEYWQQILPATQNFSITSRFTKRLGADWEGTVTASYFDSKDYSLAAFNPPFSTGATTGFGEQAALVNGKGTATIFANPGPFTAPIPASVAAYMNSVAPAGTPTLTAGTQVPIQVTLGDVGAPSQLTDAQTYRLVGEVKGTAGAWDIDASYGWSQVIMDEYNYGAVNLASLYTDLADGSYIPGIQNSQSEIQHIAPTINSHFSDILYFAGAHGSRDLFTLPGGKLSIATGADFYFRTLQAMPSGQGLSGVQGSFAGDAYAEGNQSDWSVFGEMVAPIVKMLEVEGALRYDHYSGGVSKTTPKLGFKFTPVEAVTMRGTYSEGFRAPNPVESGNSGSLGFFGFIADPKLCPNPNGAQGFNTPGNFPSQCSIPGTALTVGTQGLQPETSKSFTLGLILEPTKNFNFSIDWYDIKISDQIVSGLAVPAVVAVSPINRGPQEQLPFINAQGNTVTALTPVGVFANYLVPFLNLNSTQTRGLEFELHNKFNVGENGTVNSSLMWTRILDYLYTSPAGTFELAGTHGPSEISGDTGTPRNRAKYILGWDYKGFDITGTINYIGTYDVTDPSAGLFTCQASLAFAATPGGSYFPHGNAPNGFCNVASFTDFDLYASYALDKSWTVHGNIQNLFDRDAPLDIQTYASTNFNPSLHMEGAIGRFFNVGVSYKF